MGYLHIDNLYKNQAILLFKECYSLEKIHGTSCHIGWKHDTGTVNYFSGGESHEKFVSIFNNAELTSKFNELFPDVSVVVFGEGYGGKQQGMSKTYGDQLKFIVFDVKVGETWVSVPNAEDIAKKLGLEFVHYVKTSTDVETLNKLRDEPSVQAFRNGCGNDKKSEGIVLRPLIELKMSNGERVICKHKSAEFSENKTQRVVSPEKLQVLTEAKAIADDWVTEMRLSHVLQKLPQDINIESTKLVVEAMIEDVYREGRGEIVESREASKAIGSKAAQLFKQRLQNSLS